MTKSAADFMRVLLAFGAAASVIAVLVWATSNTVATTSTVTAFTKAISQVAPVVERVAAYGHPEPAKVQFLVAISVALSLPLLAVVWGSGEKYAKGQWASRGRGAAEFLLLVLLLVYLLFWPAHSLTTPWKELSSPIDARRRLFRSDWSLSMSLPFIAVGISLLVDALVSNLREATRELRNARK